jgi:DNA-binding NtrC family response regulator
MPDTDHARESGRALARACVRSNLRLPEALTLLDAMCISDAVMVEKGDRSRAAARLGITRQSLVRLVRAKGHADDLGVQSDA